MSPYRLSRPARRSTLVAVGLATTLMGGAGAWLALSLDSFAKDSAARDGERLAKPKAGPVGTPEAAAVPAPRPAVGALPAAVRSAPAVAGRLRQNGAGACAAQVDALAAAAMGGVAQFDTISSWAKAGGDGRAVSVSIGQRYSDGGAVPYGATSVTAAPNGRGSCDAVAVQVVPSPLPCARLRDTMATRGRQIGDLAGVPLMQDAAGETMLVPTAANTCVLVGLRTAYAD